MHRSFLISILLLLFIHTPFLGADQKKGLVQENQELMERSLQLAKLYTLAPDEIFKDITDEVLDSSYTTGIQQQRFFQYGRRIYLFEYPSDGLKIKGIISFTPNSENQPLLIFLRGGNKLFGIMNPAADVLSYKDYITITTTYRDGVSEGIDEFGGADVNDVKNLIDFIPTLIKQFNLHPSHQYLMGSSRGSLEMFLALARYPEIQNQVDKAVSLTGLLDLRRQMHNRSDMRQMFEEDFGLIPNVNEEEWINQRDPLLTVPYLKKNLPILILQGTHDNRITLEEGHNMVQRLEENGNQVTYWELNGGNHGLLNLPDRMDLIAGWLELNSIVDNN